MDDVDDMSSESPEDDVPTNQDLNKVEANLSNNSNDNLDDQSVPTRASRRRSNETEKVDASHSHPRVSRRRSNETEKVTSEKLSKSPGKNKATRRGTREEDEIIIPNQLLICSDGEKGREARNRRRRRFMQVSGSDTICQENLFPPQKGHLNSL